MTDKRHDLPLPRMGTRISSIVTWDPDGYIPVKTEGDIELQNIDSEDSDMWETKNSVTKSTLPVDNRAYPKSHVKTVIYCSILLLIAACLFTSIYLIINRRVHSSLESIAESTSTPSPTTRFHRLLPLSSSPNLLPDGEEETTYEALVYTSHSQCTEIGRSFLTLGGNAQDAAVGALFCLSAAHPQNTGLGGGFISMMGLPNKSVYIDARETAPFHVTIETYEGREDEMGAGMPSVATPGFLTGLHTLFSTGSGKFSLEQLAQPTIDLCNNGVIVDESLANALQNHRDMIINDYIAKDIFVNSTSGDVYKAGDRMYCSKYSQTLSEIVGHDMDPEYFDARGFSAQILGEVTEAGGYISYNDIEDYYIRKGIGKCVDIKDFRLCGPTAPSSFPVAAIAVKATIDADLKFDDVFPVAYREMKRIGDVNVDASNISIPEMFEEKFVRDMIKKIQAGERSAAVTDEIPDSSTILVADEFGRGLSLTASLGDTFGSRFLSKLGFFYNNAIGSFKRPATHAFNGTLDPELINVVQPGKAPRSFSSPVIGYYKDQIAFLTSGVDLKSLAETIVCLIEEEDCSPHPSMLPAIRNIEFGYVPLVPDLTKMGGY